jgi:PDZ domain
MKFALAGILISALGVPAAAQERAPQSVTVPAAVDHNRVIIEAELARPDGSTEKIHAWVDNGNPDLYLSRRIATILGLPVTCGDRECSSPPPKEIRIGDMTIPLGALKQATIPLRPVNAATVLALGMNAEINLPSTVLRNYDVLINFPDHKFSIGTPGSLQFRGMSGKVRVTENGLIQVPSQIAKKKYDLALDVGSSISFLSAELFDSLAKAHPTWPHLTGAVGPANMWGTAEELNWKVMRVDRMQYGPLFLTDLAVVSLPKSTLDFFEKRAGMPTVGLIGSNMLVNYRVGLDYAHSTVYFDIGRTFRFPDFDVVGLVLRPEEEGGYTILGTARVDQKPCVDNVQAGDRLLAVNDIPITGMTVGQVWRALGGTPGQERRLTIQRQGKMFVTAAKVQSLLPEVPDDKEDRKYRRY